MFEYIADRNSRITKINDDKNKKPYNLRGSTRYDIEASCMSRRYHEAHNIQNSIITEYLSTAVCKNGIVLDIGCGTANDGIEILSRNLTINYVGIDYSKYMLNEASRKLEREIINQRCLLLNYDFRNLSYKNILSELKIRNFSTHIICIISSMVLHHYDHPIRLKLYSLIHELLTPEGLFLLTDLFTNSIYLNNQMALEQEISDISNSIQQLRSYDLIEDSKTTLSVHHYRNDNRPSILLDEQNNLLDCGFAKTDIVYRHGQLSVSVAKKE